MGNGRSCIETFLEWLFKVTCTLQVLNGLIWWRSLGALVVEVPFGNGEGYEDVEWVAPSYNFDDVEIGEEVGKREGVCGWRALEKSWDVILKNKKHGIRSLELREPVAKLLSKWPSQAF